MKKAIVKSRAESTETRRLHIIESAAICFISKGFHQSSMRDIASTAGVSLGNLYNHFSSKEALIAEIATLEANDLSAFERILDGDDETLCVLTAFIKQYLAYTMRPENIALSSEILAEAVRNPAVASNFAHNRNRLAGKIAARIKQGITAGEVTADIDAIQAAGFILDLVEGVALRTVLDKKSAPRSLTRHLLMLVERYLKVA